MSTVLLTGARAPVTVDLARSFAAAGYTVHVADSVTPWAARLSKHITAVHPLPPPRTQFRAFAGALTRLVDRLDPVAVIPMCEEIFYVAAADVRRALAPPLSTLRTLHSKVDFAAQATKIGIVAPRTWRVTSAADIAALPMALDALVLKPEFSRFASRTLIRPKKRDLAGISGEWAAQEFVGGHEICLWAFARAGQIVASVAYRPVWRHGKSAAYAFETIDSPAAHAVAATIAAADAINGHLAFDLIERPDGIVIPIECNPRAVSGIHLFDAHPDLARAMLGDVTNPHPTRDLRYLAPAMALLGPTAGRPGALVNDLRRGRDAVGRADDRLPVLGALIDAARFTASALAARRSPIGATTDDIEWNGGPIA